MNQEISKYANNHYVTEISKSKQFDLKYQLNIAAIETIAQLQNYHRMKKQLLLLRMRM